jgi:hypothetical protein
MSITRSAERSECKMKKLILLALVGAVGFVAYRQIAASRAQDDLWTQATQAPDLR